MFEYFPDNYNWSLAVSLAIGMGGQMTEIDSACRRLRPLAAAAVDDASQQAWFESWSAIGDRLDQLACEDAIARHHASAARKRRRASVYHLMAERMMTNESPLKLASYGKALDAFAAATAAEPIEFLDIDSTDGPMPALFLSGSGSAPGPAIVFFNGFDVTKEFLYLMGLADLTSRGVSVLLCDQPGSGGALRLHNQATRFDTEVPAAACFDALATRDDIDDSRIAIGGISMGGYYAPRAASVEDRFAACVAWGAFHDLVGVATNLTQTHAHSAPPFQAPWVFGMPMEQLCHVAPNFNLDPVIGEMTCPLLVVHGESDRQVPVVQARRTHDMATATSRRDLRIYPKGAWGEEHCQVDDQTLAIDAIGDWLQEVMR